MTERKITTPHEYFLHLLLAHEDDFLNQPLHPVIADRLKSILKPKYQLVIERPEEYRDWLTDAYAKADQPSEWKITTVDWDTPSGDTKAFLQFLDELSEDRIDE